MKKHLWNFLFISLLALPFLHAGGLVTGATKMKFEAGDKVLFAADFKDCPLGEIPDSFDRIDGIGECVRLDNRIWYASAHHYADLYKNVDLDDKEFSIEYDLYFLKPNCNGVDLRFYENKDGKKEVGDYHTWVTPGCSGEAVYLGVGKYGVFFHTNYKSLKRKIHIAIQVRRGLYRIYVDGRRAASIPFHGRKIRSIKFHLIGDYQQLIGNIRITEYASKEKTPQPEKLGIGVKKTSEGYRLTVPEKVLFDFNKFILKPEAKEALASVGGFLRSHPAKKLVVTGYTDNIGGDAYNLRLSLQRAQSVADYLIYCEKIDPKLFEIEGRGKANPIADNATEEGRAKNRRVEIRIIE
ncbi:OmpA family protein [Nitratifractor sp.]